MLFTFYTIDAQCLNSLLFPSSQYINFLAGLNDYLCWYGVSPVLRDVWGGGMMIMRTLMWLHTTPAMVRISSVLLLLPVHRSARHNSVTTRPFDASPLRFTCSA